MDRDPKGKRTETGNNAGPQNHTVSKPIQVYSSSGFDDSGYFSDDEGSSAKSTAASPASKDYSALQTPQRPPPLASNDSGISVSFGSFHEAPIKIEECPESPLTEKANRRKQSLVDAKIQLSTLTAEQLPPALSRILPNGGSPHRGPETPTPRTFESTSKVSPKENSRRLKELIKIPLSRKAIREGYIYCFQIDGCAYTKIGMGAHRKNKNLEKSFAERKRELEKCGWWNAQVMIHRRVPHVLRVEQIIHKHLDAVRKKEFPMNEGSNGRICTHGEHREWFDVDFTKTYMVVAAWQRWMASGPYIMTGGKWKLSQKWIENLETFPVEGSGDNWLQWLSQYFPEPLLLRNENLLTSNTDTEISKEFSKRDYLISDETKEVTGRGDKTSTSLKKDFWGRDFEFTATPQRMMTWS